MGQKLLKVAKTKGCQTIATKTLTKTYKILWRLLIILVLM